MLLGLVLAASLLPRLPLLANAEAGFTSDEAVNALAVQHLLDGREISAFSWDATYYGMVEGLLAIPFVAVLGPTALAFKLSAVVGFLLLVVAVFLLGRALYGETEGIVAAALLTVFSPQLLFWSTLAVSGFCLIVAWGTLTLLCLLRVLKTPSTLRFAMLGFLAGFGFYIFELFLPYLALLLLAGGIALLRGQRLGNLTNLVVVAGGFAVGAAPKIALLWSGGQGTKRPAYALAGGEQILSNLRLLIRDCIPALFGVNLRLGKLAAGLGALLLLGYAAAWVWGIVRVARPTEDGGRRWIEALLVVLVPLVALLFVLSPNPQDAGSNRYLLPGLSALPLAGAALVRLGRRSLSAALAAGLLAVALPAAQSVAWLVDRGFLTPRLEVAVKREPLRDLLQVLESLGLEGGYARYWDAYKATFLAGEKLVFVPYMGWNRYPPYSQRLSGTERVAWVFPGEQVDLPPAGHAEVGLLEGQLLNQLASSGRPYRVLRVAGYRVYLGISGRLLPPPLPVQPVPLARPQADFLSAAVPARVAAGSEITVPVKVLNRSDAAWSASGLPFQAGALRVTASYRWLAPDGRVVVGEGERSLLPADVPPGGTIEMIVRARVPEVPGPHVLRLAFVQEGVAWFSLSDHPVEVVPQAKMRER
ncbi:MAG TPA: glycosyltransferase family 39 protein [Thermoanaerobaculia bacterium]|nr:glycosyltransferase family 39 protein [Thermoanaerobaculia bacterium]